MKTWENYYYVFALSDFDLLPLDLKFAPLDTLVQRYVSSNFEVSMAFLFQENLRHVTDRHTDVVQRLLNPRKNA